jgi:hypothetical protein
MSSKLSSLLVQDGVVSVKRMEEAFQRQVIFGGSLDTILLEMSAVDEVTLLRYLQAVSGLPPADLTGIDLERVRTETQIFPQKFAEKFLIVPLGMQGSTLTVLVADPLDRGRLDELGFMLGVSVIPLIGTEFRLHHLLERLYGVKMPLRFAGLIKRLGPPPVLGGPPTAAAGPVEVPPAAVPEPVAEVPPAAGPAPSGPAPLEDEGEWDDPYAGASPATTLVGVPRQTMPRFEHPAPDAPQPATSPEDGAPQDTWAQAPSTPDPGPADPIGAKQTALGMPVMDPLALAQEAAAIQAAFDAQQATAQAAFDAQQAAAAQAAFDAQQAAFDAQQAAAAQQAAFDAQQAAAQAAFDAQQAAAAQAAFDAQQAAPDSRDDWPFDPAPIGFDEAVERLGTTQSRDEIFEVFVRAICGHFEYTSVFAVFGDQAVGKISVVRGVPDASRIAQISIPLTLPSLFRATLESKGYYFGPVYDEGINFGLLAELDRPVPATAFILPVLIRNRVVCFLYADNGLRPVDPSTAESLVFLSFQISQSFQRLILQAKRDKYAPASGSGDTASKLRPEVELPLPRAPRRESGTWQRPTAGGDTATRATEWATASTEPAPPPPPPPPVVVAEAPPPPPPAPPLPRPTPPAPAVQPAFPEIPRELAPEYRMTVSSRLPAEPATPVEPVAEAPATSGRSITSIGYYSLTESTLKEDVKPTAAIEPAPAARRAYENVVKGELNTPSRSDPSPASTAQAQPATVRSEDVWSLIDDLERQDESSDLAAAALQRLGDPALRLVAYRFPGKLSHDRIGPQGELPAPSAHGPLVHFLVRVGAPAVPYLVELLGSENPEVRYYASFIFAELHAPQALAYLLERLFDSAPPVRRVTIEVLKVYREVPELRPVLEHLRAELVSPIPFRRRCAAEVLGALRDVEGVPRLIELTGDRDLEVSETAQRALLLITKQAFGDSRRRWRAWWERSLDNHRIVWLIEALGHKESECRFLAAQELHQLTGETLGYRFDQDKRDRDEAVSRWERWWETRGRVRFTGR